MAACDRVNPHTLFPTTVKTGVNQMKIQKIVMLGTLIFGIAIQTQGAIFIWSGEGGNNNWSTVANWVSDTVPSNDGTAELQFAGSKRTSSTANADWSVQGISFNSGAAAFTLNSAYTISIGSGGIVNNSNNNQTLNNPLKLTANQTWDLKAKNLALNTGATARELDLAGFDLTISNTGNSQLNLYNKVLSSTGSGSIIHSGSGTLNIRGSNSSSGGVVLKTGKLYIYDEGAIGTTAAPLIWQNNSGTTFYPYFKDASDAAMLNDIIFEHNGGYDYTLSPGGQNETTFEGDISSSTDLERRLTINFATYGVMDTTHGRLRLSGDNSDWTWVANLKNFSNNNVAIGVRTGSLYLDSTNAAGVDNNAYIGLGQYSINSSSIAGLFAPDGITVNGNISVKYNVAGGIGGNGDVVIGLDGAGEAIFAGNIKLNGVKGTGATNSVVLTAGSNGKAVFSGVIQDGSETCARFPIVVRGPGAVCLGAVNTYGGDTIIRSGTLIAGADAPAAADGALGNSANPVRLGDTTFFIEPVRVATPALRGPFAQRSGYSFNPISGQITWNSGSGPTVIDDVTLQDGDRILYTQNNSMEGGIYVRTSQDQWDRASDFDEVKPDEIAYGASVYVQEGTDKGGRNYYLGNREDFFVINNATKNDNTAFVWSMDESNPSAALLTGGSFTVGRDIEVVDNKSTGFSTIGGEKKDTLSEFSGAITLNRDLQVTAATNSTVVFSGKLSGTGGLVMSGPGAVLSCPVPARYS
jgi:autotransporter-associated beta strand protein